MSQVNLPNPGGGFGQFGGSGNFGDRSNDSVNKKKQWSNPAPVIHYKHWNSEVKNQIDTAIDYLHEWDSFSVWTYNLGNIGTPTNHFLFREYNDLGPQLNYNHYSPYFYSKPSVPFYNTTRPYSLFNYSLGSQQEQLVSVIHTQNFNPRLNVAIHVRNLNSPGFFNNLLSISNGGYLSSNYISQDQKYKAHGAFIYNKMRNDENGGILNDSLLIDDGFVDSRQIPTHITSMPSNRRRSKVTNMYRELHGFYTHEYRIGQTDTLYNEDSTQFFIQFKPEWSLRHDLDVKMKKHLYEDKIPDKNNYALIDTGMTLLPNDTLRHHQTLNTIQNNFTINGFIGPYGRQLQIEAGVGNRIDILNNHNRVNDDKNTFVNNYLIGRIRKEALEKTQWSFGADALFYFAGSHIGDMTVHGYLSKYFSNIGAFRISASQTVSSPAYNYSEYYTNYFKISHDFSKISNTHVQAQIDIDKLNFEFRFNNYLLYNYIYLSQDFEFMQFGQLISISNLEMNHRLKLGPVSVVSQAFYQQFNSNAPVNIPQWGITETLSFSNALYSGKLQMVTGLRARYIGPYYRAGYNYVFNKYYYNDTGILSDNAIELMAFLNFKVKNLSAFIMADQVQQLLFMKNVRYVDNYPLPRAMFRFGFRWTLYN